MDCHFLLQQIFLTQGLKPCLLHLLHWQADSLPLHHLGTPRMVLLLVISYSLYTYVLFDISVKKNWTHIPFLIKNDTIYWVGQKVHLDFSRTSYGKTQTNFFGQPNIFFSIFGFRNGKFIISLCSWHSTCYSVLVEFPSCHQPHPLYLTFTCLLRFTFVDKNSVNYQLKRKKNFIWANLIIITWKTDSQKLWELFHLLEVKA